MELVHASDDDAISVSVSPPMSLSGDQDRASDLLRCGDALISVCTPAHRASSFNVMSDWQQEAALRPSLTGSERLMHSRYVHMHDMPMWFTSPYI